jgi:uncharacterized membrane protein
MIPNLFIKAVVAFFLLILLDIPWLTIQLAASQEMFSKIQGGRAVNMRFLPAIVVYLALTYLLLLQKTVTDAFLSGAAVYAVYDFTNLTVFKDYTLEFAMADTLWGGVLFSLAHTLLTTIFPN